MKDLSNNLVFIILLCIVLGLAPFYPEPHLWGKIRWIAGGAVGMQTMDWLDVLWHGWPFILLIRWIFFKLKSGLST